MADQKTMTFKRCYAIVISLLVMFCLANCSQKAEPTVIKDGFSKNLTEMIYSKFDLKIPSSAIFLKGYFDNAFLDPAVHLSFKVPEGDFNGMLTNDWEEQENKYGNGWYRDILDVAEISGSYTYKKRAFTFLIYSNDGGGMVTCALIGNL